MNIETSRRDFLKGTAAVGAALVVGLTNTGELIAGNTEFVPNPFVKILPDNTIIVVIKHFEMGQGTTTGLSTLVAEEIDADWKTVKFEFAPANTKLYANLLYNVQLTGGSSAIANSFMQYREAGAAAKQILINASAKKWNVKPSEITASNGVLSHKSGKTATYGEMVSIASGMKLNEKPKLKDSKDFKFIGKQKLPRKDSTDKTNGTAIFAMDVSLPNTAYTVIARPPRFGATVKSFDAKETLKVKGVLDVKNSPRGVIVYAKNTWAAIKGREALKVEWDNSKAEMRSSKEIFEEYSAKLKGKGQIARNDGNTESALKNAAKMVEAEFEFPFLSHSPMEPLNCLIKFDGKSAEVWDGCQFPTMTQGVVAQILGLNPEQVKINTVYAGGSFGRRATAIADYAMEAAIAVKLVNGKWPVKLIYTREDDMQGGYYRPAFCQKIKAGLDKDGNPLVWQHSLAGKSIIKGTPFESALVVNGIDSTSVEGASTLPYAIPNLSVDLHNTETPVPVLWWRSVGHTHTAYSTEVMFDMLAEAAEQDPVKLRLELLGNKHPRHSGVLKLVAEKSGWNKKLPKNHYHGVAVHESFRSYVAQVAEVSKNADGEIKIERITCAIDCGIVVNPDVVRAQMEGGIGYGLGAIMRNEITLDKGAVEQSNFPDYEPLRISDMPVIDVHIVDSNEPPTGVGEPSLPPVGPAVANAIYAATGKRILKLPFTKSGISFV